MRLFKNSSIASTLRGWLQGESAPEDSGFMSREERLEDIRRIMTSAVQHAGEHASLIHRLRFATDVTALWYLRSDVMAVLCESAGELAARARMTIITQMFDGLVPAGLMGQRASNSQSLRTHMHH
jgi:hypothetical protein